ncbi:MAG: hypothetical protein ACRDD6_10905 [Tannerellaceae bacterium]
MKYLISILLPLLILVGCTAEDPGKVLPDQEKNTIKFSINIPDAEIITKGKDEVAGINLTTLSLLVFDENGRFLSRYEAVRTPNTGNYTVSMVESTSPRIIHLVGNYNWSNFSDVANLWKDERDLINGLRIKDEVAYWQRIQVTQLNQANFPATVSLIRNIAKISVTSIIPSNTYPSISNVSFAIDKQLEYGTIAPFNVNTGLFTEDTPTEAVGSGLLPMTTFTSTPQYLYERKNSVAQQPTYLIVKADYKATSTASIVTSYYKLDLIDLTIPTNTTLMDIVRNYHYLVQINQVTTPGYTTASQAAASPASNNISASIVLQPLLTISNGVSVLGVEKTNLVMVSPNQTFSIKYAYFPLGESFAYDNTSVNVQLINDDPLNPVVSGNLTVTKTPGVITGTTAALPRALLATGSIVVSSGNLSRVIKLQLRYPYPIEAAQITPNPVATTANTAVTLKFDVPQYVPDYALPMKFYISAPYLSPNNALNTLPVIIENQTYKYEYTATTKGTQTLYFKTNTASSSGPVTITNPLFGDGLVNLVASATFTNVFVAWLSIKPKLMYNDQQVILNLQLPAGSAPVNVKINTTSLVLDPNNLTTGEMTKVTAVSGGYQYAATTAGSTVQLYFKTSTNNATESITLQATGFTTSPNLNQ